MNRLIRVLRDRRGESMVEILVSTVVFMLPNCRKACAGMQKSRTAKLPRTILR